MLVPRSAMHSPRVVRARRSSRFPSKSLFCQYPGKTAAVQNAHHIERGHRSGLYATIASYLELALGIHEVDRAEHQAICVFLQRHHRQVMAEVCVRQPSARHSSAHRFRLYDGLSAVAMVHIKVHDRHTFHPRGERRTWLLVRVTPAFAFTSTG